MEIIDQNTKNGGPELIRTVEKIRGQYQITFDNNMKISMKNDLYNIRPLRTGDLVDISELIHWLVIHQYKSALEKAVALLAARERSRSEIRERLLLTGYHPDTIEIVLYKLSKEHLLNDAEFAEHWARSRSAMKYGKTRIANELSRKGVSSEDIQNAVKSIDNDDQRANAEDVVRSALNRAKKDEPSQKTAHRILSMLARRGYDWDTARSVVESVMKNTESVSDENDY